jgi:deoxyribose-phosphate aldolase
VARLIPSRIDRRGVEERTLSDLASSDLASRLEHVLLRPAITATEVGDACAVAVEAGLAAVHVWPTAVADAVAAVDGSGVEVVAAVGAPWGAALRDTKLDEARRAIVAGARHLALAVDAGAFRGGDAGTLVAELATACYLAHAEGVHVRAVLNAGALTEDERVIAGRLAAEAGADLLQTGFGLDGDATAEEVSAVRRGVPPRHRDIAVVAGGAGGAAAATGLLAGGAERVAMLDPARALGAAGPVAAGVGDGAPDGVRTGSGR